MGLHKNRSNKNSYEKARILSTGKGHLHWPKMFLYKLSGDACIFAGEAGHRTGRDSGGG